MEKPFSFNLKVLVLLCFVIILSHFTILSIFAQNPPGQSSVSTPASSAISIFKDFVNILFFIIIGILAILSYLQARKTLFTPIKTETFKLQLQIFEDILLYFDQHDPADLDDSFDFQKILNLNAELLLLDYVNNFFPGQWDTKEQRDKIIRENPYAEISLEYSVDFVLIDSHVNNEEDKSKPLLTNPAVILAKWQKYEYGVIHYSEKCKQQFERLKKFRTSPLVPAKLKKLILDLESEADENLECMRSVLTDAAKEFPEKYPSLEEVKTSQFFWINNRYIDKRYLMDESAGKILDFINNYLNIEGLLK